MHDAAHVFFCVYDVIPDLPLLMQPLHQLKTVEKLTSQSKPFGTTPRAVCGRLGRNDYRSEVSPGLSLIEANFLLFAINVHKGVHASRLNIKPSVVLRIQPKVCVVIWISVLVPLLWI